MPELTELKTEQAAAAAAPAHPEATIEDDAASDTESEDTIPELEDAGNT